MSNKINRRDFIKTTAAAGAAAAVMPKTLFSSSARETSKYPVFETSKKVKEGFHFLISRNR